MLKSVQKFSLSLFVVLYAFSMSLEAEEYPTIDRVLYVNECVRQHGGGLDSLYKCSCVMDYFTKNLS